VKFAFAAVTLAALVAGSATALPQKLPWQTSSSSNPNQPQPVQYLYPQQVTLQAGKPQTIDLHFRIANGLHINSHTPRQKSLIRTELIVAEPTGVSISAVDFPPGSDYAFPADPQEKLSVYTGDAHHGEDGRSSRPGGIALPGVRHEYLLSAAECACRAGCDRALRIR